MISPTRVALALSTRFWVMSSRAFHFHIHCFKVLVLIYAHTHTQPTCVVGTPNNFIYRLDIARVGPKSLRIP